MTTTNDTSGRNSPADWRKAGRDAAHEDATHEDAEPCTTLAAARVRCAAWLEDVEGADVEAAAEGYLAGWAAHLRDAAENAAPLDLDAIEARANAASEGPWHTEEDSDEGPGGVFGQPREFIAETYTGTGSGGIVAEAVAGGPQQQLVNATFIAHARRDVPALTAEVRRLRGQLAACVEALGVVVPPDATAAHAIVDEYQRATGEARALRLARDAAAQAFDDLVAKVWRAATGDEHEGDEWLTAWWGPVKGEGPDMHFSGPCGYDRSLLNFVFYAKGRDEHGRITQPSLVEELEARGYDVTTLEFRVRRKPKVTP